MEFVGYGEVCYTFAMGKNDRVLVVCLNPTFQKSMVFPRFHENEVNRCSEYFDIPSGKGVNVARDLIQLGRRATVLTHLGGNRVEEFLGMCKAESIPVAYFLSKSPIRTCTTIIDRENHTSSELVEEPWSVEEEATRNVWDAYQRELPKHAAVIFTGTRAKGYAPDLYPEMVKEAKKAGKLVLLDVKGKDLLDSLPYRPDLIKPNLSELSMTMGKGIVPEQEASKESGDFIEETAKELYRQYGTKSVISHGKYPVWVYDGSDFNEVPVLSVPVVNTIGCGDALTAGIIHKLLDGDTLLDAVTFGIECAARNAQSLKHGVR